MKADRLIYYIVIYGFKNGRGVRNGIRWLGILSRGMT